MGTDAFVEVMHEVVAFVRVAEAGSFSAAARRHGMTPSAISRQVARLERALGVVLLRRTTRQLHLTEAGLDVLERGRAMVAAARATLQVAEGHVGAPRGLVRLSAPKAFARHVLQQPLLAFLQRHPDVDLHLMVTDRLVDPLREGVDVAVRLTDAPPPGMVARVLMPVRQLVLASPAYLAVRGPVCTPAELAAHSCLALGELPHDNRWHFARGDEALAVAVAGRCALNHSEMRLAAIEAGLGVGCVPDFVAHESLAEGRVVQLLADWSLDTHYQGQACLLYPPARHTTPKVRALVDHLVQALARD